MGLLKHRGEKKERFLFSLAVHTLAWPSDAGSICVTFQRGSHSGATRRAAPSPSRRGGGGAVYVFEEQLNLDAALFQDAAAARKGSSRGLGPFLPKELRLSVNRTDSAGKPAGPSLGTVTINLADYAAADGRIQQAFTIAPAGGRLLLTIGCRDSSHAKAGAQGLTVEASLSSLAMEAGEGQGPGGLPTSMSTDEEGSSRATSPDGYSRPASAAAAHNLAAVPEDAAEPEGLHPQRQSPGALAAPDGGHQEPAAIARAASAPRQHPAAATAARGSSPLQQPSGQRFDDDGILVDDEGAAGGDGEGSQQASASVRRDLGSALERAEASEAGSRTAADAASAAAAEVQSRPTWGAEAAAPAAAAGVFARLRSGAASAGPVAVPATPVGAVTPAANGLGLDPAASTGQQSSILSAGGDPAVPFSVPPSTSRRFAQRDGAGVPSRRWAWRRNGGGGGAGAGGAAGAAPPSAFQRARLASSGSRPESPAGDAGDTSAHSGASSGRPSSSQELGLHPTAVPARAPQLQQGTAAAAAGLSQFQAAAALSVRGSLDAPASTRQRGAAPGAGGLPGAAPLRPSISLVHGDSIALPSPAEQQGGGAMPASPFSPGSMVVEALLQELRSLAALESAVYLTAGRAAFSSASSGSRSRMHTPARRLARTIISLGPQEGLAFGLQAIRAVEAVAGAASGDMHRLTFWWSNILQLRWMIWALCQRQGLCSDVAADAATELGSDRSGLAAAQQPPGGEQLSPRAAMAAAAAVRSAAASEQDWMQVLLPQLRELESWLFAEMLKHLWWRVLMPGVTAQQPRAAATPAGSGGGTPSAITMLNGSGGARTGKPPPAPLSHASSGVDQHHLQGTPRSFESAEEEAVHRWVRALAAVDHAFKQPARPAAAPRQHLTLLHRQLVVALLRRLDTLLFRKLLAEDGESSPRHPLRLPSMSGRGAFDRGAADVDDLLGLGGAEVVAVGLLEPGLLPFPRGPLTFSTGVHLKMAVSRLTGWAADCGVKEDRLPQAARSTEMSDYRLFPCLRATADLLMMPKEVLTDREMRREVVPGLPLHRICQLLQRFEPDDCAPDPLPPGLLEALQSESPRSEGGSTPSPTCRAEEEYLPPSEEALLSEGVIEPLSLAMGEESEDELESMAAGGHGRDAGTSPGGSSALLAASGVAALPGDELRASRFALLRDLWAAVG